MPYNSRKKKISGFIAGSTITDDTKHSTVQEGINKTFTQSQILDDFADRYGASLRTFEFEAQLIASNIRLGEYAIVEENDYAFYKITNIAASLEDVTLTSGLIATFEHPVARRNFDSVADMKLANLEDGFFVYTDGYYGEETLGGSKYFIKTAAQAASDGDTIDGYGNHALTNGNVAILQIKGFIDIYQYGVKGDGVTDDNAAVQAANNYSKAQTNPVEIVFQAGIYLLDGIILDYDFAKVSFRGKVVLKANSNDTILFHQIASFAEHSGTFKTDSNGHSGVWGMGCVPLDRTQTTTLVQTNHNEMPGIVGDSQLELCIGVQCGPDVGGADSGCFYNVFPYGRGRGAIGGIRLFPGTGPSASSPNRNTFRDFRMGTGGGVSANFGIYLESGDTNKFFGCDFEGVGSGVARTSPLATPTAIRIIATDANGIDNSFNTFFGGQFEVNTRDLHIDAPRTFMYGVGYNDTKSITPSSSVFQTLPARDASAARSRLMGIEYTNVSGDTQLDSIKLVTGKLAFPSTQLPSNDVNTLDDYREGTFTPGITFGGGSTGITFAVQNGFYTKIGREVNFRFFIALSNKGSDTGAALITGLPFNSNSTSNNFSSVDMRINKITYTGRIQGYISTNTNSIILEEAAVSGSKSLIADIDFANDSSLIVSGSYMV
jgi:hypothetical protein